MSRLDNVSRLTLWIGCVLFFPSFLCWTKEYSHFTLLYRPNDTRYIHLFSVSSLNNTMLHWYVMTFCGFFNFSGSLLAVNLRVVASLPPSSVVTFGQLHTPPRRTRLTITSNLVHCALTARCQHTTQLYNQPAAHTTTKPFSH